MLEVISNALEIHKGIYEKANEIWVAARKHLESNYIGNLKSEKINAAKNLYENTLMESRKTCFSECLNTLNDIREKCKAIISRPVPAEFTAILETIKNMKNPTSTELEAIAGAYKNNYLAYRAICDVCNTKGNGFMPVIVDDVFSELDALEKLLHRCFYSHSPLDYEYRIALNSEFMGKFDDYFTAFLDGRFGEIPEHNKVQIDVE